MPNIGPLEIVVVVAIVLLIFGPKRLPELGRSLGSGMRNFKDSITGKDDDQAELTPAAKVDPTEGVDEHGTAVTPAGTKPAAR